VVAAHSCDLNWRTIPRSRARVQRRVNREVARKGRSAMATDPTSLPLMGPESLTAEIVRIEGCLSLCGRELKPDPTDIATLERRRGLCTARLQAARRTARFVTRAAPSSSARPDHGNEHLAPALLTRWPEPGLSGPSIPLVFPLSTSTPSTRRRSTPATLPTVGLTHWRQLQRPQACDLTSGNDRRAPAALDDPRRARRPPPAVKRH
jgi:hypothetical protein